MRDQPLKLVHDIEKPKTKPAPSAEERAEQAKALNLRIAKRKD